MDEKYTFSPRLKYITLTLICIGVLTVIFGFFFRVEKTWANLLLNNYYFISIAIGATFYYAIQYITQSGWSAQFQRIPLAIGTYLIIAGILILLLIFGMESLYHWSHSDAALHDPIIAHKSPYLNKPFFFIRIIVFFSLWILMTRLLLMTSIKEDQVIGLKYFNRSELYSKIYIFILAVTFSLFTFDLIMSIDVHWFSTVFAIKNFISGFYHSVAIIVLIVLALNNLGYYKKLNKSHLHSFSKYIFILGIIWVYLLFVEYLVIWIGNIQEETIYFVPRIQGKWKILFFMNIILNWIIPFFVLMSDKAKQNKQVILFICIILIIGQWVDLYLQIMPGALGEFRIGIIEIGIFAGYIGLFTLIVGKALSKIPLIPKNHPYLKESNNYRL